MSQLSHRSTIKRFRSAFILCATLSLLVSVLLACERQSERQSDADDGAAIGDEIDGRREALVAKKDNTLENFTSKFTKFSLDRCRVMKTYEESGGKDYLCPGYKSTPLHVGHHDLRHYVVAGPANDFRQPSLSFNTLGATFEWRSRVDGEEPFAVIYRYIVDHGNGQGDSLLAVAKVGRDESPGCVMAIVAASSQQNLRAREFADAKGEGYDCEKDPIQRLNSADKS